MDKPREKMSEEKETREEEPPEKRQNPLSLALQTPR